MKPSVSTMLLTICLGGFFALTAPLPAQESEESVPDSHTTTLVSPEILESRIAEIEAATGMEEKARNEVLELYRKALGNLQAKAVNEEAARAFQQAGEAAHGKLGALEAEAKDKETAVAEPVPPPEVNLSSPLRQIEHLLQQEKAGLAALDARRAEYEQQLDRETNRPLLIRKRVSEAKREQEEVSLQLQTLPGEEDAATTQARHWALETRYQALNTEMRMLDQELLTQPIRLDILKLERDKAVGSMASIRARVATLEQLVTRKHQEEADKAKAQAESIRHEAEGKHRLVVQLAERNARMSEQIANIASELDGLAAQMRELDKLARQIEDDFKSARESIEIGGLNQDLGHLMLQQRQSLPDLRQLRSQAKEREEKAVQTGVLRLRHRQEQGQIRDQEAFVAAIALEAGEEDSPILRGQLHALATERRALLVKAIESDDFYLRKLGELEASQQRLLEAIEGYDKFLDIHLLWVRSASRAQLEALGTLPEDIWRILSPKGWQGVAQTLRYQAIYSPILILLAVVLAILIWRRKRLVASIRSTGKMLGKPTTDQFYFSVQAFLLTMIVPATWPLAMAVIGWQLKVSVEGTNFSSAVGGSLIMLALHMFYIRTLSWISIPGGLAAEHFRWSESNLRLLRREMGRLTWIFLPAATVAIVAFNIDPLSVGRELGQAAFVIVIISMAAAIFYLLHPQTGLFAAYVRRRGSRTLRHLLRLFHLLLPAYLLVLGGLSLMGYIYTAGVLFSMTMKTAWLAVDLLIVSALVQRWLLVTRRHLVYEAAMERRQSKLEAEEEQEKGHSMEDVFASEQEGEGVDFIALSDTSRQLLNSTIFIIGAVGLWLIWFEVLPALHILNEFSLWQQTVTVDGEQQVMPVTLADLSLALVYLVTTIILTKKLPAVLEIILLHNTDMSASGRYTFTTLTSYVIIAVGLVMVFNTIGADWSKLQWLVAALGVGIGFGLQEIVANFISGIIILFERPVRVGDVITVGDTDGIVTRIQIRATTIRSWDGKELLVPNKEFITGRLLNWSLSDVTTRLLIRVGIAYGANVRQAMGLLEQVAEENEEVLKDPSPSVIFENFGDNSLNMTLRCFVETVDQRMRVISDLNRAVNEKFEEAGIVIAFPQRDVHLNTSEPLHISIEDIRPGNS